MTNIYKSKSFLTKKRAFTLIELLIVIAIIGILFIVLVSKIDFATDKAKATGVQTDFRSFQIAFDTVAKENAGFNTFGWDTGDLNQDGIRNSYDEGDNGAGGGTAKNGIQDGTEVFTGHKVYDETFTKVFSLKKAKADGTLEDDYDCEALNRLEAAINANLDPKLHITIKDNGEIVMANGAQDPWNNEYHGWYITNAEADKKDRGAIVMYSDGANCKFGSEHNIANGVVSISIPGDNKWGKDDYALASIYTFLNGYGEVKNITTGFSNNQTMGGNNVLGSNQDNVTPGTPNIPDTPDTPDTPDEPEVIVAPGLYTSGQNYAPEALITPWDELVANGIMQVDNGAVKCLQRLELVGDLLVPNDGSVTAVANSGFYRCVYLTDIKLPETVVSLGASAFEDCMELTNVVLPDSITDIGDAAFKYCQFTNIKLPNNLTNLGQTCFSQCWYLTEIVIPDKVTDIKFRTFYGNRSLSKVVIGDSVTSIEKEAFYRCGITDIVFSEAGNLTTINQFAFYETKIKSLNIPDGVLEINNNAFQGNTELIELDIADSVNVIGMDTFYNCTSLKSVYFGKNLETVSQSAFENCTNLTTVNFQENLIRLGSYAFRNCNQLTYVNIPKTVKNIGTEAFKDCISLKTVQMPTESCALEIISPGTFENCILLEEIIIPYCRVSLAGNAFQNCTNLKYFYIENVNAIVGENMFTGCENLTSIHYGNSSDLWNKVSGDYWIDGSCITEIHCTDTIIYLD